jgi:long-subunit acyl-CoA synthetase (AMP-forming)
MVDILMPYAEAPAGRPGLGAARLSTLRGRTIGIVNNNWRCMDLIADELATVLRADFGATGVHEWQVPATQTLPDDTLEAIVADCDAVVVGIGN